MTRIFLACTIALLVTGCATAPTMTAPAPVTAPAPAGASAPASAPAASDDLPVLDWSSYFGERPACFALIDVRGQRRVVSDEARCSQRLRPFSTFKIPNALIGLETGALADASAVIPWDSARYPAAAWWPEAWRRPNDLRSAIKHSAVPYFRTLARRIGEDAMKRHLVLLGYGNQSTAGGLDSFWLSGDLSISALEQIAFLEKLQSRALPVSRRSMDIVADVLEHERGADHVIRAKTGLGLQGDGSAIGWWVGWVERGDDVYVFALHLAGASTDEVQPLRIPLAMRILTDLGVLPAQR